MVVQNALFLHICSFLYLSLSLSLYLGRTIGVPKEFLRSSFGVPSENPASFGWENPVVVIGSTGSERQGKSSKPLPPLIAVVWSL